MPKNITLIPIGPVPAELLPWLEEQLSPLFGCPVVSGKTILPPAAGSNAIRRQYNGETIIAALRSLHYPEAWRLVGLIDEDCYVPGLNFIFAQALKNPPQCFVALPRLRPSFYGGAEDQALFHERALKEVVHELGHTRGLAHCSDRRCVMCFSNTLGDTDRKGRDFCRKCCRSLDRTIHA